MLFPYRGEIKELGEDARAGSSGSFVQLSKGLTHYDLSGPFDGKVVVLIHGICGPFGIWSKIENSLSSQGFRILKYDLYGRGYSDRPDVSLPGSDPGCVNGVLPKSRFPGTQSC